MHIIKGCLSALAILCSVFLFAQEGHQESVGVWQETGFSWIHWIGHYHFLFVHFPIALIVMAVVAEAFGVCTGKENYFHAAKFMLIGAFLWAIPTVLLGLALASGAMYEGATKEIFEWHRLLGLLTLFLSGVTLIIFHYWNRGWFYYIALTILFVCLCWTATLGSILTFN